MNPKRATGDRKRTLVIAAVCVAMLAGAGARWLSRRAVAASDLNILRQQRAAMRMPDPEQMRAQMFDNLARNLALTESQKSRLRDAMEGGTDLRALFEDRSLSREQRFARMREASEARDARIREVLTPEQHAKYQQLQEQMRAQFRNRRGMRGGPGGPNGGPSGPSGDTGGPRLPTGSSSGSPMKPPAGFSARHNPDSGAYYPTV